MQIEVVIIQFQLLARAEKVSIDIKPMIIKNEFVYYLIQSILDRNS
jgi:hypothetical protein